MTTDARSDGQPENRILPTPH